MSSIGGVSGSLTYLDIQAQAAQAEAARAARASDAAEARSDQAQATQAQATRNADLASSVNALETNLARPVNADALTPAGLQDAANGGTALTDLRTNLETALRSAEETGTDNRTAVANVLQDAGVDVAALQGELAPPVVVNGPVGPRGADGVPPGPTADGIDAVKPIDASDPINATGPAAVPSNAAGGPASTAASALAPLLDDTGVDPTTFKSTLTSILDNGSTDVTPLFATAEVGSSLDIAR